MHAKLREAACDPIEFTRWTLLSMGMILNSCFLAIGCATGGQAVSSTPDFAIGQRYGGGIIFHLDQSGAHGLIAAPSDQGSSLGWFNGSNISTGAAGTEIGTGLANTLAIVAAQGSGGYAASLCADLELNGFNDWFLPSKDELATLYGRRTEVGGFSDDFYWSSTEQGPASAWEQGYTTGMQYNVNKNSLIRVRAIRVF